MTSNNILQRIREWRDWQRLPLSAKEAHRKDVSGLPPGDPGIEKSVQATIEWLCQAQSNSATADGGVARHYSVIDGWGPSYPETTGYIVGTLIARAKQTDDAPLLDRARRMLDWLLDIQLDCGGFQGGTVLGRPVVPVVFNTGQILLGLSAGADEFGEPYTSAAHRAASWLAKIQDPDGCWREHASPFAKSGDKTYDTHVAWGMLNAARATGNEEYADSSLRNVEWAISRQLDNGWFKDCCLSDPEKPLTHTIGYTLRGIIEGYIYSGDNRLLDAARRTGTSLTRITEHGGFLPGRLDGDWRGVVDWVCLTGSVQIAHCLLLLYQYTREDEFLRTARALNKYVRRTVDTEGSAGIRGGIRGAFPISGAYGQYEYLNWAAKFFVDSQLAEKTIVESAG